MDELRARADAARRPHEQLEALFKVKVLSVNTILRMGMSKSFRGMGGKHQDVMKAIVRLAEGDKIDVTTRI